MVLSEIDQQLTMILIDHDMALQDRRKQRSGLTWPDESDIFIKTRQAIHEVVDGRYEPPEHWRDEDGNWRNEPPERG